MIYILVRRTLAIGVGALFSLEVWANLHEALAPSQDDNGNIVFTSITLSPRDEGVNIEEGKRKTGVKVLTPTEDFLANNLLRYEAPHSLESLKGRSSVVFIIWVIAVNAVIFTGLMINFTTYAGCTRKRTMLPIDYDKYVPGGSKQLFTTNGNHLCDSRVATSQCYLFGTKCSDYQSLPSKLSCANGYTGCKDVDNFGCSFRDDSYRNQDNVPVVNVDYVTCQPIYSALMNSIQYTVYAQILVIGIFFLVRRICFGGVFVIFSCKTWLNL